jgi:4-amino-4-deoxychorismate lyase
MLAKPFQTINLDELIVPKDCENGLFKCRIIYSESLQSVEFLPYTLPKISSLKLVVNNQIDYSLKFADRSEIQKMFGKRGLADDVLIVKNGWITDTSFANILFFDGKRWLTPEKPLLKGTQRENLLRQGLIFQADISPANLPDFSKARLINAMIRFEDEIDVEIGRIES